MEELIKSTEQIEIYILIWSPIIIIPLNQNNDRKSSCIILNLGNIKFSSEESSLNKASNTNDIITFSSIPESKFYDNFSLKIDSIKISYYNTYEDFEALTLKSKKNILTNKTLKIKTPAQKRLLKYRPFKIIKKFEILCKIQILKEKLNLYTEKPRICINIKIQKIILGIHFTIINKIKKLTKILNENIENSEDLLLFEKRHLLEIAEKIGIVTRYDAIKDVKERRFVILADMYLYFFESPEKAIYENYYYLRNLKVEYSNRGFVLVNSQKQKLIMLMDDDQSFEEWLEILKMKEKMNYNNISQVKSKKEGKNDSGDVVDFQLNLEIDDFTANFYDIEHILWSNLRMVDLSFTCKIKTFQFEFLVSILCLYIDSYELNSNFNSEINCLLSSCPFNLVCFYFFNI